MSAPGRKKFFLWIHLFDPHAPYKSPEPFASRYGQDPYDGEIAYVDSVLGTFLESGIAGGWYDKSLIWFTSDHGESLGEHGEESHGFFLYDSTLRVPSIVKLPLSHWKGTRVADQGRSVDVAPTILSLVGLKPGPEIQGESLLSRIARETKVTDLVAYSETYFPYYHFEWSPLHSVCTRKYKYIKAPDPELYDLEMDPGEKTNLAVGNPDLCKKFSEQLSAEYIGLATATPSRLETGDVADTKKLLSLGYVGMSRTARKPPGADLPDPKNKISLYRLLQDALTASQDGRIEESTRKLQQVLKQDDHIIDAHLNLGVNYAGKGSFAKAADAFRRVLELDDHNLLATFNLALCYAQLGNLNDAIVGFRRTLELNPRETEALVALGRSYQMQGEFAKASTAFKKAIDQQPNLAEAHGYLSEIYRAQGKENSATREPNRLGPN